MAEVSELLQQVISLIERDVKAIDNMSRHGDKLDHNVAADLVRYSSALLDLNQTLEAKERITRSNLAKLSTEELMKKAKEIIDGKKE